MSTGIQKLIAMKGGRKTTKQALGNMESNLYMEGPIIIEYSYNYPINELQHIIIQRIRDDREYKKIESDISDLRKRMEKVDTIIERRSIKETIKKLDTKKEEIRSGEYMHKFLAQTNPLIQEYKSYGEIAEHISFMAEYAEEKTERITNLNEKTAKVSDIVERYFKIVSRYVDIQVNRKINTEVNECLGCNYDMSDVYVEESGEQTCPVCKTIRYKYNMAGHKGIRSFTGSRLYDVQVTFRREVMQFQGKEKVHIPEEVYDLLDQRFQSLGMPPAAEIRKLQPNEYGKMPGTSRALLDDGLQSIGYPSLYKHANKIGKKLWGWVLHDLSEITPLIMKDFNTLQAYFSYVDKEGRSSNTCSQARLLQHLRYRDVKVDLSDFKLPGTTSLVANENIFRQMCLMAGMEYKPLFPNIEVIGKDSGITVVTKEGMSFFLSGGDD